MKTLILALFTVIALPAFACLEEAQFIGTITEYKKVATECSYKIDFSMYNESMVCPLNSGEASTVEFKDESCVLKDGDQVSGVLVKLPSEEIVIE